MSPAWSLEGGSGGATPPAPPPTGPSTEGLVFWVKGDAGLVSAAGVAQSWADQSGFGQDLSLAPLGDPGPFTGLDTIDGVPCVTFPTDGGVGAVPGRALWRADMRDRLGAPFGYGVGEHQARTIFAVLLPRNSAAFFNVTGGLPIGMSSNPNFGAVFDLEAGLGNPDGFYAWSLNWRSGNPLETCAAPDATGGPGGTYDGVPTLAVWTSTGFPDIGFTVNNVAQALTPSTMPGATGPSLNNAFWLGRINGAGPDFFGATPEILIYDFALTPSTDPAAYAQTVAYLATRFPSVP